MALVSDEICTYYAVFAKKPETNILLISKSNGSVAYNEIDTPMSHWCLTQLSKVQVFVKNGSNTHSHKGGTMKCFADNPKNVNSLKRIILFNLASC